MIERNTVLVLGAGASLYYGYPSGRDLVRFILHHLNKDNPPNWIERLKNEYGIEDRDLITDFYNDLYKSNMMSIDDFLDYHPKYGSIGKLSIALALIPLEDERRLFDITKRDGSWYEYLLDKLRTPKGNFSNNNLSIITFNYDRSLEHYLFTSLKHTYSVDDKECANLINSIQIVHVYGMLDHLPWHIEGGRPYGKKATPSQVKTASNRIFTLSDGREASMMFAHIYSLLEKAQFIYFLGFGYHEINLKRLNIENLKNHINLNPAGKPVNMTRRIVCGTTKGLGKARIKSIHEKWNIDFPRDEMDIMTFFNDFASLI